MPPENTPHASVSLQDNTVTIDDKASKKITSITYVENSLVITADQPFEIPPSIPNPPKDANLWKITLKARRQKSKGVADAFNAACRGAAKEYTKGQDDAPEELNFYFSVTIRFKDGGLATVHLAQGSRSVNNWWIGGKPISRPDIPRLEYRRKHKIVTNKISGDHETFKLEETDVRDASPVTHVIVLMLENHSFDNMLALSGIPGILKATHDNCNSYIHAEDGKQHTYCFKEGAPSSMPTDPGHEFPDVVTQLAGVDARYDPRYPYPPINNSGFVANYAVTRTEDDPPPKDKVKEIIRGFIPDQIPNLHFLAKNFAVCDQWFSSLPGPTWPNRFFLHGASSHGFDHSPDFVLIEEWLHKARFFRYPHGSIFDRMDEHGMTWALFQDHTGAPDGRAPLVAAIHNIHEEQVRNVDEFLEEVRSESYPYQYTFIEPNYGDAILLDYRDGSSQHPRDGVAGGEHLIMRVYNALVDSPIWEHCVLIITYDEHGGFYDHFPPGKATPPGDGPPGKDYSKYGFDFRQYGVRVPAVVVSPFTWQHGVDHETYDHTSVLATLESLFGLHPLTDRDGAAHDLMHLFLHPSTEPPPKLEPPAPIQSARPPVSAAEQAAKDLEPIPDGTTLTGILGVTAKADAHIRGYELARARFATVKTRGDARVYIREVRERVDAIRAARGAK